MERIVVTVSEPSGNLADRANIVIQEAIEYVASLGGGTVRIGEGIFRMESTLHLRSNVKLEGSPGKTVLYNGEERISPILADADLHESQVTVKDPGLFPVGQTIMIRKAEKTSFFFDTVAVVVGKRGNVLYLDRELHSTILLRDGGIVTTQTPVISGYDCEQVEIRNLIVEGNKEHNHTLANGCRSAGIFLFAAHHVVIEGCTVRNYNGDGISYQHCSDIRVLECECVRNGGKGIHPGSGTTNTQIRNSRFIENEWEGIYLCWRVRDSVVEHCTAIGNKMSGISIGHKDTHNVIRFNQFTENQHYGILFRDEAEPMAGNYNHVEGNVLEDNGSEQTGYAGIRISGYTHDIDLVGNRISFTKAPLDRTIGVCLEEHTEAIRMEDNEFVNCSKTIHSHWLIEA
jgi:parallel beta-helix repeat protein